MIAVLVRAVVADRSELSELAESAPTRALNYIDEPGLLYKAFVFAEESLTYGASYLWSSAEAADNFFASRAFQAMAERFPTVEIDRFEVAAVIDRLDESNSESVIRRPSTRR